MKCVLLCVGYTPWLYPLTLNKPKALLEIRGKPLLDYTIERIPNEIEKIYIVTNDKFYYNFIWWLEKLKSKAKDKIEIINDETSTNESRRGGIGGLNFVIESKQIDDDILVVLGDNYFNFNLSELINFFKKVEDTTLGVVSLDREQAKNFGVVEIVDDKILSFEEKPENPKSNLVSTGLYIFTKEDLKEIKEYMKTDLNK
ncbi:hypothetical protein COU58_03580, partial [Candidatus Pacearchaeota archaeon CG10_big_fil_rev_8_21_14_0_10_32_42]